MAVTERLADGRWQHTFRQSSIKTATLCLERARRDWFEDTPQFETDAACVGTAAHAVFEINEREYQQTKEWYDQDACIELWDREYESLESLPNFRYVKYNPDQARNFGHHCVRLWHQEVRETLDPEEVEITFDLPLFEDDQRVIRVSGTMDLIDRNAGLCDYKTSGGGKYREWEYERWAIQPTVYTFAAAQLGFADIARKFEYIVLSPQGVQRFNVTRGPKHWAWLKEQCKSLAQLIEAELPAWPQVDTHALCSDKWCPHWSACKGAHLSNP